MDHGSGSGRLRFLYPGGFLERRRGGSMMDRFLGGPCIRFR